MDKSDEHANGIGDDCQYRTGAIEPDDAARILRAALMSKGCMDDDRCELIIVEDRTDIEKISDSVAWDSRCIRDSSLVVAIVGDDSSGNRWLETCSASASAMIAQSAMLSLRADWTLVYHQMLADGVLSEDCIRGILDIPEKMSILGVVSVGHITDKEDVASDEDLHWENIHIGKYS